MGTASVVIYQPIATLLGHPEPGGMSLKVSVAGESTTLREAMTGTDSYTAGFVNALEHGEASRISFIVVNGCVNHARMDSLVREGDVVSVLPVYAGG